MTSANDVNPPSPPATTDDPSAPTPANPTPDAPPPAEGDIAGTLGAPPAPENSNVVEAGDRVPGQSDGRPLAQQIRDSSDPLPPYDVPAILTEEGVPPEDIEHALEDIFRNEPLPDLPHWDHGLDNHEPPSQAVDPVDVFAGSYMSMITDVQIPSRGFPLQLTRFYRSGPAYYGPWGYNWDHSYNVYLRELRDGGAAIWTGHLSEHVYRPNPEGGFDPPTGIFRRLEYQAATGIAPDRYVLTDLDGTQQIFTWPQGWPHPDRIPMVRLEDRHGNAHQLTYDAEGRLERVEDHAGRYIQFIYGDRGLLEQVTDHTGRLWRYTHDPEVEHLIAVTTPTTPDHPEGLTTCYEYDRFREHPALIHNLTRVIDPAGQVVVENQYGDDPYTDDFGRVVYQEFAGFVATFHATHLQYVPRVPDAINVPALRVEVVDPGVLHVYTFNYRGNLLDERFRLVQDGSYRLVARIYRYDEQGNLIEQREPNGLGLLFTYDHENADPRARGNLLRASLSAPPTRPAPGRVIAQMTYEPRYQRIRTIQDEAGVITGASTTFVYDYEETPVDHGDVIRIELPPVTLPDGSPQDIREQFTYNEFGQLIMRQSGEGHLYTYEYFEDSPALGYLKRTVIAPGVEDITQEFSYDLYGNVSAVTRAGELAAEFEYNALGQLVRSLQPLVNGERGETTYQYGKDGRLHAQNVPRGSYQDDVIADPYIRHEFDYDVLGHLRSLIYGVNTAQPRQWQFKRNAEGLPLEIVDPLGRKTQIEYDERNQPLKQTLFAGTADERTTRFIYERNGPLSRIIDPLGHEIECRNDSWDRRVEVKLPGPETTRTRVSYHYGVRNQLELIETIGVPAHGELPRVLTENRIKYDELGRTVRQIQGAIWNELWYDRDSRLVHTVNQRGNTTVFTFDALGRVRSVTDPLGNSVSYTFDQRGNLSDIDTTEIIPGRADPETYHVSMHYDARNRIFSTIDPLGNTITVEYDDRNLMIVATTPLGDRSEHQYNLEGSLTLARSLVGDLPTPVEHHWQIDLGGRVEIYTDPEGQQTRYAYGLDDQWSEIVLPDGSTRRRMFNAAGQLMHEMAPSGTEAVYTYGPDGLLERTHFVAGPDIVGLPDLQSFFDGLGRPVRLIQGDITHDLAYDQLGRLTQETLFGLSAQWTYDDTNGMADLTYPDGRVDRHQFDALGRLSSITLHQLAAAPVTGPSLNAGSLLVQYGYAGPQRLLHRVLGNGCQTHYSYDRGGRLSGIDHRDVSDNPLALVQYVYDALGRRRVMRAEPMPGQSAVYTYDQLSRLRQADEGMDAPEPPLNATQEEADAYVLGLDSAGAQRTYKYTLDRADTRTEKILTDATGTTTEAYGTNDLHQIADLTRSAAGTTSTHAFTYDRDGRRTGDDRFTYTYDVMGRLTEVHEVGTGNLLLRQSYDPLGRVLSRSSGSGLGEYLRYLGDRLLQHETPSGETIRQHCFGMNIDELIAQSQGEEQWGHQDARLSLITLTDSAGSPIERYNYTPFGLPTIWAADGATRLELSSFTIQPIFGGHRAITFNGLYDARARAYDTLTGSFLQRDALGYSSSANPYVYTGHNPIDLIDPTGNDPEEEEPDGLLITRDLTDSGLAGAPSPLGRFLGAEAGSVLRGFAALASFTLEAVLLPLAVDSDQPVERSNYRSQADYEEQHRARVAASFAVVGGAIGQGLKGIITNIGRKLFATNTSRALLTLNPADDAAVAAAIEQGLVNGSIEGRVIVLTSRAEGVGSLTGNASEWAAAQYADDLVRIGMDAEQIGAANARNVFPGMWSIEQNRAWIRVAGQDKAIAVLRAPVGPTTVLEGGANWASTPLRHHGLSVFGREMTWMLTDPTTRYVMVGGRYLVPRARAMSFLLHR
jgi:RHS repeat-associated protein